MDEKLSKEIGESIIALVENKVDEITAEKSQKLKNIELIINNEVDKVSDGYHTFDELYFHRLTLFAMICRQNKNRAWRSKLHHDGTMFEGGYFVVGITTPKGEYTYHYKLKYWDKFDGIKEFKKAPEWDGHQPSDIERLYSLLD